MKKSASRFRMVLSALAALAFIILGFAGPLTADQDTLIKITAKRFEFAPSTITVKKGSPVVLEFTSLDTTHGFYCPSLGIRTDIPPRKGTPLRFVAEKAGTFSFHCDKFCGEGHEEMVGTLIVTE